MSAGGNPPAPSARTLWLVRHAKAEPAPATSAEDHERPLTGRGRRDAASLGAHLLGRSLALPEVVVCSDAARAAETAGALAQALGVTVEVSPALYGADPSQVLEVVRALDPGVRSAMVVGHNPAVHELAWALSEEPGRGALGAGFPTCSCAVLAFEVASWAAVAPGTGTLVAFFQPPYAPAPG